MAKVKILVSKCLLGENCRYKGDGCRNEKAVSLSEKYEIIPVCPEQAGGLPTPRDPSEIQGNKVISSAGQDVTAKYNKGAEIALELARTHNVEFAVLKARSPSCGKGWIYDGTFTGTLKKGNGITAELLTNNGYKVYTEEEI